MITGPVYCSALLVRDPKVEGADVDSTVVRYGRVATSFRCGNCRPGRRGFELQLQTPAFVAMQPLSASTITTAQRQSSHIGLCISRRYDGELRRRVLRGSNADAIKSAQNSAGIQTLLDVCPPLWEALRRGRHDGGPATDQRVGRERGSEDCAER